MPRPSPITAIQESMLVSQYTSGTSRNSLAKLFNASRPFVTDCLRRHGVHIRNVQDACRIDLPKGDVFADAESNPEAAYWIGFLMADGCISKHSKNSTFYIILQIAGKDRTHLERFRDFLGVDNRITIVPACSRETVHGTIKLTEHVRLAVGSSILVDSLARYGVVQRKSATASVIGLENNRHFWRGVIDGDGTIGFRQRTVNCKTAKLSLLGSKPLVFQFQEYVRGLCSSKAEPFFRKGAWYIHFHTQKAAIPIRAMYDDCSVALPRKLEVAQEIIAWYWP